MPTKFYKLSASFQSGNTGHGVIEFVYHDDFLVEDFLRFATQQRVDITYITLTRMAYALNATGDTMMKGQVVGEVEEVAEQIKAAIALDKEAE